MVRIGRVVAAGDVTDPNLSEDKSFTLKNIKTQDSPEFPIKLKSNLR